MGHLKKCNHSYPSMASFQSQSFKSFNEYLSFMKFMEK